MRPHLLPTACTALLALTVAGCGSGAGADRPPTSTVAATDPASRLCSSYPDLVRQTCESAYFSCRDHPAEIRQASDVRSRAGARTTSVAYVKAYWADWEPPVRDAARRGCHAGLRAAG